MKLFTQEGIPIAEKSRLFVAVLVILALSPSQNSFAAFSDKSEKDEIVNQEPVAGTDFVTTDEDTPVSGNVLLNDHDPEGGVLRVVAETITTAHGQAVLLADGSFTYTPNPDYHGSDSFEYKLCDDGTPEACCTGLVEITIQNVQDAPVANPDFYTVDEDIVLTTTPANGVLSNDTDADGNALTAILGQSPAHGTIILNANGSFTYTPNLNYFGTDTFTYYANDGTDNSAEAVVTITINPVNDAPVAVDDQAETDENVPVDIPVLANDYDVDNVLNGSMIIIVTQPAHGTAVIDVPTGIVTYTPNPDYHGNDSFTYKLDDLCGCSSNIATVNIVVNPVNTAPVAVPDQATTLEDVAVLIPVLANDTDDNDAIDPASLVIVSGPANGTAVVQPNGEVLYTPKKDYFGTDTFTYTVKDDDGATSLPATVTIVVTPVNDPPIAVDDFVTTNEDVPVNVPLLANDIDVDDVLDLTMVTIVTPPTHGTLVINPANGTVIYTPKPNYFGPETFSYQLKDPQDALSNIATVSITVNPVNDAPVAAADNATTPEDVPVLIPVLTNDTDADSSLDPTSLVIVSAPSNGSAVPLPNGEILYTPNPDYFGTDTFTYTVKDAEGATSAPATVTVVVTPVNDAPVAVDDDASTLKNTPVGIPVLANDYDVDNDLVPSSVTITTNPQNGTVAVNTSTGVVTYSPQNGFAGNDQFKYTIRDPDGLVSNIATVRIAVVDTNLPPVAVDDGPIDHLSRAALVIDVLANDYDPDNSNDELTIISVTNPSSGSVRIENRKIIFQPEGTISSTITFRYTIQDPGGLTDEAEVTIRYDFRELIVSQGFSPNGDGNNDTWYIQGIEGYPNNIVKVFDRWGLLVFQKSSYNNTTSSWDGRANTGQQSGRLLDRGTYYYLLEPGDGLPSLNGFVVLIR